ncbi:hypothetical protein E0Z10_g6467 [Xylaria hypoxylon]|uniref:Uncharacterized protein n=1 Tax=Xylaria hypoxylon TaxID=37992 RepID=A0A4Z0Z0U8_9PEZI|nr:hypothetical protein E0Z10_g6467 [Xylaria hypoxylon]
MSHHNNKIFGVPLRLGLRMVVLAAIVACGFAATVPVPVTVKDSVVKATSCLIEAHEQAQNPPDNVYNLNKKQGPYVYGNGAPYPNITSTSGTLTITITSTDVTTMTAPYGTFHGQTGTDSCNYILVSSTADGQTNSVTSSNDIQSSPTLTTNTVRVSSPTSKCTNASTHDDQSSSTQLPMFTTMPHITVTTTILYSVSGSEWFTSTETVTETPHITITKGTTTTLSSAPETSDITITNAYTNPPPVIVTVTVYVSQPSTQTQTGAASSPVSGTDITISEAVTATVLQTVSPVPTRTMTTECTESTMTGSDYVVPVSSSFATVRSTLTITVTSVGLDSSMEVSPGVTTVETGTTMTTVTSKAATTSTDVYTTYKASSVAVNSTLVFTTVATLSATTTHTLYPVRETSFGSVIFVNSTSAITVGIVTASVNVTTEPTPKYTGSTHMSNVHLTGSTATAYPTNATSPISSGANSGKKRPVKVFWGDSDGGCSHTCVILLVMIVSLIL